MNPINTTMISSDDHVTIFFPKELLRLSGLNSRVQVQARRGKIIISNSTNPREGWSNQIKSLITSNGNPGQEFANINLNNAS